MTRYHVTATKTKVIFRRVSKTARPIALVYDDLYRMDDNLFIPDGESKDAIVFYDSGEQQPWGRGEYLDPDFTKALIDSMKMSKQKPTRLFDMNIEAIMAILIIGVVAFSALTTYMG